MTKKSKVTNINEETKDESQQSEAPPADPQLEVAPPVPDRDSNEAMPEVLAVAQTITGCTDNEVKNFIATADYVAREVLLHLAQMWSGICKTAEKNGKDQEKAAAVSLTTKISIDQTNILLMDTVVETNYSKGKESLRSEHKENLAQTEFKLSAA